MANPNNIIVTLPSQRSYLRAGFKLSPGRNVLRAEDVSEKQLKKLKADPHIKVQMSQADKNFDSQPNLDTGSLANAVKLDIDCTDIAESLHPLIAILLDERPDKKPTVDDMKFEFNNEAGETKTVKPSAADRDAAWEIYQDALDAAIAEAQTTEQGQ